MSLLSTLNNASAALQVFSRAIDLEGTNVANAATPGYAATRTSVQPIGGSGASVSSDFLSIDSAGDAHADAHVRAAGSEASFTQARAELLSPLNQLFDVTGAGGLLAAFQDFSSAFADLATTPNDQVLRSAALSAADAVAVAFRKAASGVDEQKSQIDTALGELTNEINRLSAQIRDANVQIRRSDQPNPAQDALRRSALDQLASLIDITVSSAPDGSVTVLTGGQQPLVIADQVFKLSTTPSGAPPNQVSTSGGGASPGAYGGKLGALLDVRNTSIASLLGNTDTAGALNTFARGFASRVNTLLSAGETAAGLPGTPIFTYDSADDRNAARTISLDPTVTGSQLALATGGLAPQANGTANALARLFNSSDPVDFVSGLSLQNLYSSIASAVGQGLSTAREQFSVAQTALTSAAANRQRISGVSLDESAIAITTLQRFYQASAKLVSILDTLTNTEINLIR